MKQKVFTVAFIVSLLAITNLMAQTLTNLSIHGYGGWCYGQTDGNHFILATDKGDYHYSQFTMNINANPNDHLSIHTQISWEDKRDGQSVKMDYAFGEWSFSDILQLRIGKIKQPFGIYTEIFDVGTLRPFFTLPLGIYGIPGFATKFYHGIGFTGRLFRKTNWDIQYDIYGGQIYFYDFLEIRTQETPSFKDAIGFRFVLNTPLNGLNVGVSAYSGNISYQFYNEMSGKYLVSVLSLEYLSHPFLLRSEYFTSQHEDKAMEQDGFFCELAYTFFNHLQLATRYDWTESTIKSGGPPAESLLQHESRELGINYWFNPNFVIKFTFKIMNGNRFAPPHNFDELIQEWAQTPWVPLKLKEDTKVYLLGTQFAF